MARSFLLPRRTGQESGLAHESSLGPIQLALPLENALEILGAEAHLDGKVYEGVMDAGRAVFLLPNEGSKERSVRIVLRTREGKLVERSVTVQGVAENGSAPEQPYELREARRRGLVLKRDQIYGSGPPNEHPDRNTLELLLRHGAAPLLDVGCGIGTYVEALTQEGLHPCGLEVRSIMWTEQQGGVLRWAI